MSEPITLYSAAIVTKQAAEALVEAARRHEEVIVLLNNCLSRLGASDPKSVVDMNRMMERATASSRAAERAAESVSENTKALLGSANMRGRRRVAI